MIPSPFFRLLISMTGTHAHKQVRWSLILSHKRRRNKSNGISVDDLETQQRRRPACYYQLVVVVVVVFKRFFLFLLGPNKSNKALQS